MISNKSKILFGGGGLVILLICIVLILVMTKSSKPSTDSGLCPNGKSKIMCSDNITRCPDDCNSGGGGGGGGTCPPGQVIVKCTNNSTQCATKCNIGTSWICNDATITGSCQTGGTGGTGATGCCPDSIWDNAARICKSKTDTAGYNIKSCPNGQVPNRDKTRCIDICRTDGMRSEDSCYSDSKSSYFTPILTSLKDINRTFCYRNTPDTDDTKLICYHMMTSSECAANDNGYAPVAKARANIVNAGYEVASGCGNFYDSERKDCYFTMKDDVSNQFNLLSNPDFPVYLYLKEDPKFASDDDDQKNSYQHKPIHCWDTNYAGSNTNDLSYPQFSGPVTEDNFHITHIFPDKNKETVFCDGVLDKIAAKS